MNENKVYAEQLTVWKQNYETLKNHAQTKLEG